MLCTQHNEQGIRAWLGQVGRGRQLTTQAGALLAHLGRGAILRPRSDIQQQQQRALLPTTRARRSPWAEPAVCLHVFTVTASAPMATPDTRQRRSEECCPRNYAPTCQAFFLDLCMDSFTQSFQQPYKVGPRGISILQTRKLRHTKEATCPRLLRESVEEPGLTPDHEPPGRTASPCPSWP